MTFKFKINPIFNDYEQREPERASGAYFITEVDVAVLDFLRDCADGKKGRNMWQTPAEIKKYLKRKGVSTKSLAATLSRLQTTSKPAIKSEPEHDPRETGISANDKRKSVYRILREGRMILIDVNDGSLEISESDLHGDGKAKRYELMRKAERKKEARRSKRSSKTKGTPRSGLRQTAKAAFSGSTQS